MEEHRVSNVDAIPIHDSWETTPKQPRVPAAVAVRFKGLVFSVARPVRRRS